MAVPASYNDLLSDPRLRDHVGDVWYQTHGPRAARLGAVSGSCCASIRDAPGHRLGGRGRGRRHEGGYTPFEADVTDVVAPARELRGSRSCVNNDLTFQSIPPGLVDQTAGGRRAALLPRLLQLRRDPSPGVAVHHAAGAHRRHHRRHRSRRHGRNRRATAVDAAGRRPRGPRRPARRRGRRGRRATGAVGELTVAGRARLGAGRGLLLRARRRAVGDGDAPVDSYHLRVGIRTVAGRRHASS